ncbi:MAG: hypothetical protein ACT4PO_03195, partial [Actinomycetota bacterium]
MKLRLVVASAAAALFLALVGPIALGHPPSDPYDNTIFAPIQDERGFKVGLELAASNFTSPLKGVVAP